MKRPIRKPELLAPAGDLEKLKTALHYGADAVYLSGENYGLRAGAENFSMEEMAEGVTLAHKKGARVYLALNIFAHNADINSLPSYLREIESIGVDAIIVSDAGVIDVVKESLPGTELHLSTQANTTNWRSIAFWKKQGVSRVCVARELSLDEIREVKDRVDIEIEAFVHGAMCISYSGRCLISSYMTGRSANLGDCAHPCRYRYALVEETRLGEYFPVEEDERGTYMMSSKDLCMIEHLDKMFKAGIGALKIEGRTKGIAYVGNVVRIYRKAIDRYLDNQENYRPEPGWLDELNGDAVGVAGIGHLAAFVGPGIEHLRRAERLDVVLGGGREHRVDIVDIERDMGEAGVAGPRLEALALGRGQILDQLQAVTGRLQKGDLELGAVHADHALGKTRVARPAMQQREPQHVTKEADCAVQARDRKAGVIGR